MGLFSKKKDTDTGEVPYDDRAETLEAEIARLTEQVDRLQTAIDDKTEELGLSDEVVALKKKITELEITADRKKEDFDRREREVEHKVGLERKRQEFELEAARRETAVALKEENLKVKEDAFKKELELVTKTLSDQVGYLKDDIVKGLLERLPTVTWDAGRRGDD